MIGPIIMIDFSDPISEPLRNFPDSEYVVLDFEGLRREPSIVKEGQVIFINCGEGLWAEKIKDLRQITGFKRMLLVACFPDKAADYAILAYRYGADYVVNQSGLDIQFTRRIAEELTAPSLDDIPYAGPFIESTSEIVSVMAGMELGVKDMYFTFGTYLLGDISGLMNLSGNSKGRLAISFDEPTARALIAAVLGLNENELNRTDVEDGVYEAVNMVAGNAKAKLAGSAHHFEISTPKVIRGILDDPQSELSSKTLVMLFETSEDGNFALEICLGSGG